MSATYGIVQLPSGFWRVARNGVERGDLWARESSAREEADRLNKLIAVLAAGRKRRRELGIKSARDSQKSRLYNAENLALIPHPANRKVTLEEAQELVNRALKRIPKDPAVRQMAREGIWKVRVTAGRGGGHAECYGRTIRLGVWGRQLFVVYHELAHCVCRPHEKHGRDFARVYLKIIRRFMGKDAAEKLRAAYKVNGVKYQPERKWKGTPAQRAALARGQAVLAARRTESPER